MIARVYIAWLRAGCSLLLLSGTTSVALSQNEWAGGLAFETAHDWKLGRGWKTAVGFGTELRPLYTSTDGESEAPPTLRNLDLNFALQRRWLERWRFGNALRLRSRYPNSEVAAREVRNWFYAERITDAGYVRWAHRFRTEQRWRGDVGEALDLTYRHRYRVAAERALAGLEIDDGEWFFNAGVELLLSTGQVLAKASSVDIRPAASVGRGDWQVGLEYRHERAVGERERQRTLLVLVEWDM